ncbi:hypothetical protein GCM10010349_34350 [Streptomyces flavofungini]|nr:hypothetical protein GCM10010349_34350 [Streptomyces flavofungini]
MACAVPAVVSAAELAATAVAAAIAAMRRAGSLRKVLLVKVVEPSLESRKYRPRTPHGDIACARHRGSRSAPGGALPTPGIFTH